MRTGLTRVSARLKARAGFFAGVLSRAWRLLRANPRLFARRLASFLRAPRRNWTRIVATRRQYARINAAYAAWLATTPPAAPTPPPAGSTTAPLISVIMPVCDVEERFLTEALDSVLAQGFPDWELCAVDDASTRPGIRPLLERYARRDPRVRIAFRERRGHISAASNQALAMARGDFIALLDHDDRLTPDALEAVATVIAQDPEVDFIYSDEDKLDPSGRRIDPFFKPTWSPTLLTSCNYITHFAALRRGLVNEVGGFRDEMVGSQDHDLFLRAGERARAVAHIPRVLYSWRMTAGSTATASSAKPYAIAAARRALADTVARRGWDATVEPTDLNGLFAIRRRLPTPASVSLLIHGQGDAWRAVLDTPGLRVRDLVFLDPASRADGELALDLHRGAGRVAIAESIDDLTGEYFLLLDAASRPAGSRAVAALLEPFAQPDVALVGGLTTDRRGVVLQAGAVLTTDGQPVHASTGAALLPHPLFSFNLKLLAREVTAVPAACCAIRAATWREHGGWRGALPPDLASIDFGLRARQRGYRAVAAPLARFERAAPLQPIPRVAGHHWPWTAGDDDLASPIPTPGDPDGLPLRAGPHAPRVRPAHGAAVALAARGPLAPRFAINIVTHESADRIDACLACVFRQRYADYHVTVIDNASRDATLERLAPWEGRGVVVVANQDNRYYSRAHNQAIALTDSEWVLTLNPDVLLHPDYLAAVAAVFERFPGVGSVNGRLLLPPGADFAPDLFDRDPAPDTLLDGAGLLLYRSRRPYLRGNRRRFDRACLEPAFIFGADGAAAAYRRAMLRDVAVDGEVFDEDFVIYREDVDLAWRAQLLSWDAYYTPDALAYHRRGFHLGRDRRGIAPALRRHSIKNGWLLLLKNDRPAALLRHLPWALPYQAKIVAGLLAIERTSLGAVADVARLLLRTLHKRRQIQRRRRRTPREMARWFE